MCIVIDTNTVAALFDAANVDHAELVPVYDWIVDGKGKVVYGGTTYAREVFRKIRKYNRVFVELDRRRKVVRAPDAEVDRAEARIKAREPSADFDDAHIVAIHDVCGCLLLCSRDSRADRFVKQRALYKRHGPPKIYRKAKDHAELLCDENIARCCEPRVVLNKKGKRAFVRLTGRGEGARPPR